MKKKKRINFEIAQGSGLPGRGRERLKPLRQKEDWQLENKRACECS